MPAGLALQIPHPKSIRCVYRHLLREATYLPTICRPWVSEQIRSRFRKHQYDKSKGEMYVKRTTVAHKALRYLRSANLGHMGRMMNLCWKATGRRGKRRRLLQGKEFAREPASDNIEAHSLPERLPDWLDLRDEDLMGRFAAEQLRHQADYAPTTMTRSYDPESKIPKENIWGLPLSRRLTRNKLKRHWAGVLGQLMPPLPADEWNKLRDLANASNDEPALQIPARRRVAVSQSNEKSRWDWEKYVSAPMRSLERKTSRREKTLSGEDGLDPRGYNKPIGTRYLSAKVFRRLVVRRLWESTPLAEDSGNPKKPKVTWGSNELSLSKPKASDLKFFRSLPADQSLNPRSKGSRRGKKAP